MSRLDLGKVVPKKGVDYYTNEDKQEIVSETTSEVLSEISLPTKTSDLVNDSGFITNATQNLANYYLKNETYSQSQVNDLINAISTMSLEVVQTLPTQDISTTTIYLVPKQTAETQDIYDEFVYINNEWEHIGSTEIDLSNYYNKTQTDTLLSGKQANITSSNKLSSDLVDDTNSTNKFVTSTEKTTWNNKSNFSGNYNDLTNKPTIPTQLNQLSGDSTHRLVTDTEKNNWNAKVGTTDYASSNTGGVVKGNVNGFSIGTTGNPYANNYSYSQYDNLQDTHFISKGTLENVITGKELVNQTTLDNSFEMTKTADVENGSQITDGIGYARLNKIYGNTEQDSFPEGYTVLDYIESTGTQYIDTGLIGTDLTDSEIELTIKNNTTGLNKYNFNGAYEIGKSTQMGTVATSNNTCRCSINFGFNDAVGTDGLDITQFHKLYAKNGLQKVNDVQVGTKSFGSLNEYSFLLFARTNKSGTTTVIDYNAGSSISSFTVKKNGKYIRYLAPCYRNSDNKVGMYDLVTNTFFTNSGTGDFIAGNEITIPNPDYPQDVRVVTGDNTIKVEGKNLFNKDDDNIVLNYRISQSGVDYREENYYISPYIKVEPNTQYTKNSPVADAYHRFAFYETNAQSSFISVSNDNTITTPNNCQYLRFCGLITELDTTMLAQSQTYNLSLGTMELCKIGDYQDYIYKDNGKWYKHSEIGKVILDGSENWMMRTTKPLTQVFLYASSLPIKGINVFYSNYFIYQEGDLPKISFSDVNGEIFVAVYKTLANNVDKFKTWLSTHNTSLYYILDTPTETEITDTTLISQLESIYNFTMYLGITNFTISSENSLPSLNITYAIKNRDFYSKEETDDLLDKKTDKTYVESALSEKQNTLVSGENIKTINNQSILGSGNITISGGGSPTDVQINGTSITSNNTANILTNSAYSSSNKIATMTDIPSLTNYVQKTDYATANTGGVLKATNGFQIGSTGNANCTQYNYSTYNGAEGYVFISKGTLENVITGKNLETANNKVTNISSSSTDTQYPSAKCVYDLIGDINSVLSLLTTPNNGGN